MKERRDYLGTFILIGSLVAMYKLGKKNGAKEECFRLQDMLLKSSLDSYSKSKEEEA